MTHPSLEARACLPWDSRGATNTEHSFETTNHCQRQPRRHGSPSHLPSPPPLFIIWKSSFPVCQNTGDFVWEESVSQQPLFFMSSFVTSLKIIKTTDNSGRWTSDWVFEVSHFNASVASDGLCWKMDYHKYAATSATPNYFKTSFPHVASRVWKVTVKDSGYSNPSCQGIYLDTPVRLKFDLVTLILTVKAWALCQEEPDCTVSLYPPTMFTLSFLGKTSCYHTLSPMAKDGCDRNIGEKHTAIRVSRQAEPILGAIWSVSDSSTVHLLLWETSNKNLPGIKDYLEFPCQEISNLRQVFVPSGEYP